jgi:hypothetical protein
MPRRLPITSLPIQHSLIILLYSLSWITKWLESLRIPPASEPWLAIALGVDHAAPVPVSSFR